MEKRILFYGMLCLTGFVGAMFDLSENQKLQDEQYVQEKKEG